MPEQTPVVFVHGLWLHSDSWTAWMDLFREHGYEPSAPGWPGDSASIEGARKDPDSVAGFGVNQVVDEYVSAIGKLDRKPVVIGHSFGGLIVQRLLDQGVAAAAVAIDAAPIKGVLYLPPSALKVASVALRNPANRKRSVSLTEDQFRYGFGNAISEQESKELYARWAIPSPGRPLFEAAFGNFSPGSPVKVNTKNNTRGPLLLIGGGKDHTVPASITRATKKLYDKSTAVTDVKEFPDRGHSLALDNRWREVADYSLEWLKSKGF
jgi:non-heme chloroperoxidase